MALKATAAPGVGLLRPDDHALIMIDFQSQMAFATKSIDPVVLRNNVALVAKAAKEFSVSTIVTTVAAKTFSGPIFDEIRSVFPDEEFIDRTSMNTWEDSRITDRVNAIGKSRIVIGGLWTTVCVVGPALSALDQGFEDSALRQAGNEMGPGGEFLQQLLLVLGLQRGKNRVGGKQVGNVHHAS